MAEEVASIYLDKLNSKQIVMNNYAMLTVTRTTKCTTQVTLASKTGAGFFIEAPGSL